MGPRGAVGRGLDLPLTIPPTLIDSNKTVSGPDGSCMKLSEHINALNIEVSSRCTAHCPFCSRQQKKRPYGDHLITLDEFKRLPEDLLRRLRRISFDGNFGDLSCNPEFVDIVAHARELNPAMMIGGHTNGAVRDEAWWRDLGRALGRGYMVFALDGLEDTHGLHRRGTDYHRILKNMAAFIQGGGAAHWQFVVFQHNAHQVEEAEKIARDMGCARFFCPVLPGLRYYFEKTGRAGLSNQTGRVRLLFPRPAPRGPPGPL